jgi:cytochrome b6-f complex iron-sulfur subunit
MDVQDRPRPQDPSQPPSDPGRRRLLNVFLGGSLVALFSSVIYPVLRFLSPPRVPEATTNRVEAGPVNDPQLLDQGYKIVRFGSEPVILIRVADDDFRAFSATCTHLDCIVQYAKKETQIICNCHNGVYDLTGRNVGGPPPRPLTRFDVHVVEAQGSQPASLVIERA